MSHVSARGRLNALAPSAKKWLDGRNETKGDLTLDNKRLIWGEPISGENVVQYTTTWTTLCGRYRIVRSISKYDPENSGFVVLYLRFHKLRHGNSGEFLGDKGPVESCWSGAAYEERRQGGYLKKFKSLEKAMEVLSQFHCDLTKEAMVATNIKTMLQEATARGFHEIVDSSTSSPGAVPKAKNAPAAANKPKPEPMGKDRFGMRLGTRAARINAVLSKVPQTMHEILEKAKYDHNITSHLQKLIELGFVKREKNKHGEKTYKLIK